NVTGLSAFLQGLPGKRLELLKEALPAIRRVGVLWDMNDPRLFADTQAAAQVLGVQIVSLDVRGPDDFDAAFEKATRTGVDALFQLEYNLLNDYRHRLVA